MKIMVGYDGTPSGKSALDLAIAYAKAFTGKVWVVASLSEGSEQQTEEIKAMEEDLEQAKNRIENENIPCETHLLVRGLTPGEDFVRYAQENDIDKIVIGSRQRSKVGKPVFGSNAQYVILQAHCPVTTVK